jgi:asparagine synthase (glutamine-hydrolysing)
VCGIVGICNLNHVEPPQEKVLRQMLAMIRHRGPDQFGIYLDEQVGLGNARLSIIDLGGGQQPITNEDGTLWIVFNGEIFNYIELRPELEARGHRFATHCDTEIILHLYEEYGPDCLQFLNGQFAIAIWDTKTQTLFLARDRVGVRPLFYTVVEGALIFGSEIKAILADPRVQAEIDPVALDQVFTCWSPQTPRTIFRNIVMLPPGHYLLARSGEISLQPYWQLNFPTTEPTTSVSAHDQTAYIEELRRLLVDAAQIRLRADVPVGAYLSGGLDSSVIAAIIRHYTSNRLDTFSIAFSDPDFDESVYQYKMADLLGTEHQVVYASYEDIGRVFPEVVWHAETPLLRTAPAPMYLLAKLVRQNNFKVVLTGEGADEFLAGYNIFKEAKVRRFWAKQPNSQLRPLLLKRLYPYIQDLAGGSKSLLASFFGEGLTQTGALDYSHAIRWHNTGRTRRFLSEEVSQAVAAAASHDSQTIVYPPDFERWGPLQQAQYLEVVTFLSPYLLSSQGDRMGMAHAVEGRFPFLDYRVIEFCNNLPANLKLKVLKEKYLLKRVAQAWLPDEIWQRPKRPYRAPIHRSFFPPNGRSAEASLDYVRELLSPPMLQAAGLFKPAAVNLLVNKIERGQRLGETDDMALAGILSGQLVYWQFIADFKMPPPLHAADDVKVCRSYGAAQLSGESL